MMYAKKGQHELIVTVIGLGYVGLTLSMVIAENGLRVKGIEKNEEIYKSLSYGKSHFYEAGIQRRLEMLISPFNSNRLFNIMKCIDSPSDIWIITVGTPLHYHKKTPNLEFIKRVANELSQFLKPGDLVIARSTVTVGTTRNLVIPILEKQSGLQAGEDFYVVFAPERTIEGAALEELKTLPQIIGGFDHDSVEYAKSFFEHFVSECILAESIEAAEMIKLIDNTYRDFLFAYSNQMSLISAKMGINFNDLVEIANHNYSRNKVPMPSPGVGGPCLSKDSYILHASAINYRAPFDFVLDGRKINESIPENTVERVLKKAKELDLKVEGTKIFLLGLAFKGFPPTSDIRDSIALEYIKLFKAKGYSHIAGYDQYVKRDVIESLGIIYKEIEHGVTESNIVMILNNNPSHMEEPMFADLSRAKKPMIFFDGWNQFNSPTYKNIEGLCYMGC